MTAYILAENKLIDQHEAISTLQRSPFGTLVGALYGEITIKNGRFEQSNFDT